MRPYIALVLLALHLSISLAAPQNKVETEDKEESTVSIVSGKNLKGDPELLNTYQNDDSVRVCRNNECRMMRAGDAKALDRSSIAAVFGITGDAALTKALTPTVGIAMESVRALDAQKARLETLQAEMAKFNSMFSKGASAAESANARFNAMMTKGISLPAAPQPRAYAAALPLSKGAYAAPPSKGSSAANSMQLEAAMCPMTMYELGKSQKLYAETNSQLQRANSMNAMLMGEKRQLENDKALLAMGKSKAEQQAAFNAKYAAEQKSRADLLEIALAKANAEKAALAQEKAGLEVQLSETQAALLAEKQTTAALTAALNTCQDEKATLEQEKAALINELKETQDVLRRTQRDLDLERNAHARTQRVLDATKRELEATEAARRQLEQAKQELEDELAETKDQLETMTAERDQLQVTLDATSAMLSKCSEEKMQCNVNLSQEKSLTASLQSQLADATTLLAAEKKAREDLTALLVSVKNTAESLQDEVQKLQIENVQLKTQLMKLKSEQEAALAMAAGCPPTYEKFGLSCYKYVREKTQWKMAQEQCMKDGGNLVSVESRQEQAFLVDYLKRHGAESDTYALTAGNKQMNHWKWLGSNERYIGQSGPEYWFNQVTKTKPGYDCQAMYLRDSSQYGKWVGLPCYSTAPFTCEYLVAPPGTAAPANPAESLAMYEMFKEAPAYLSDVSYNKGSLAFSPPSSKGMSFAPALSKGAAYAPSSKGVISLAMASKGY